MATKRVEKRDNLRELAEILDRRSYEWLGVEDAELLDVIERAVMEGAQPRDIHYLTRRATGRDAISDRCLQAARHIARGRE